MERFTELAIVLKNYSYQERDRIAVVLTQDHGRLSGVAKGGVHSRRFGGSLDFLACSRMGIVLKPGAEMCRIDEAVSHHEFSSIHKEYDRLTAASFAAEFCLRLLEPHAPAREMFVILSNALYQLDAGMPVPLAVNVFLCKALKAMGYPPSLLRCVQCAKGAHEIVDAYDGEQAGDRSLFFWSSESGGMVCWECAAARHRTTLDAETLLYFQKLTVTPFKELEWTTAESPQNPALYRLLTDFLGHHVPGTRDFKSLAFLNEGLS